MYGLWRVIVKEFFQLRLDRRMIPVLIGGPLIQLLALGYAANTDVNHVPTLLVDQDGTPASRSLVDRFTGSGYFSLVGALTSTAGIEPWLVDGRAQLALVIPGGYAPDHMRRCEPMIRLTSTMAEQGKIVAAICHGPWMLCSTQALKGRKATCFVAIKDDVINAGGKYVDAEVIRDGNLITSRKPDDLPAFLQTIIQAAKELKPAMAGAR